MEFRNLSPGIRYRIAIIVIAGIFAAAPLSAESSFAARVMPGYYFPLADDLFEPGFGAAAAFDFMLTPVIGFFAQGEYVGVGLENVDAIPLIDGSVGAGFVWRFHDRMSLRADLMGGVYSVTSDDTTISGISAGARVTGDFHLSPALSASLYGGYRYFAYTPEPFLQSLSVGVSLTLNLSEAFNPQTNISASITEQEPVFPVLYSWYDDNNFAVIQVTNNERNTITNVNISFFLEQYMGQPKLCATVRRLGPGETVSIPATAFFNEAMLELTEKIDTEARVIVEYRRLGSRKRGEVPVSFPVFHRNAMSWEDNRRAAAFVSSKDPAALWFSKYVASIVARHFRDGINRNIQYAMGLYEGLNVYGINYVIDPSSSYQDMSGNAAAVDFLQYPYQTLMYRAGDCDDLSILYCSLLEAIGIRTAFVTIPGHIFMAFDSGMTEEEARTSFHAPNQLVYHQGNAWVPVEITLIKEGFNKAWRIGAKEWNDAASRGTAEIFPMRDSWTIYKPVSVPGAGSRFNLPDEDETAAAFDIALDACVESMIRPQIRTLTASIAQNDTPEARNQLGILYGEYGMLDEAREEFTLAAQRGYEPAWTNIGNLLFMEQRYDEALDYFTYALSRNKNDSIAILGSARCCYELDDFIGCDTMYNALLEQNPALGEEYAYLSSFFASEGRAYSLADRLSTTPWSPQGTKGKRGSRSTDRILTASADPRQQNAPAKPETQADVPASTEPTAAPAAPGAEAPAKPEAAVTSTPAGSRRARASSNLSAMLSITGEAPAEVFAGVQVSENVEAPRLDLLAPPKEEVPALAAYPPIPTAAQTASAAAPTAPAVSSRAAVAAEPVPARTPAPASTAAPAPAAAQAAPAPVASTVSEPAPVKTSAAVTAAAPAPAAAQAAPRETTPEAVAAASSTPAERTDTRTAAAPVPAAAQAVPAPVASAVSEPAPAKTSAAATAAPSAPAERTDTRTAAAEAPTPVGSAGTASIASVSPPAAARGSASEPEAPVMETAPEAVVRQPAPVASAAPAERTAVVTASAPVETRPAPVEAIPAAQAAPPSPAERSDTRSAAVPEIAPSASADPDPSPAASEDQPAPVEAAMTAAAVPAPARQAPAESAPAAEAEHENAASPSEPAPLEAAAPAEGLSGTEGQSAETETGESVTSTAEQPEAEQPEPEEIQPAVPGQAASPETAEIGKPEEEKKPFAKFIPIAAGVVGGVSALGAGISLRMRRIRIRKGIRK